MYIQGKHYCECVVRNNNRETKNGRRNIYYLFSLFSWENIPSVPGLWDIKVFVTESLEVEICLSCK
jgi:hypothetical protein